MTPIDFDVIVFKENNTFVAYCPQLDISSCGNNVEHAKEMLKIAARLFLEEAEKMGTLKNNLRTSGISREEYFELLEKV